MGACLMIDLSSTPSRPILCGFLVLIASMAALGADEKGQEGRPWGKVVPDPPEQGQAWNPPATKLPKELIDLTVTIYGMGVADPRGCVYREIELEYGGLGQVIRGFVLPRQPENAGRFAIGWDGQLYRVGRVGERADLDRDIKEQAENFTRYDLMNGWSFMPTEQNEFGISGVDDRSPIKLCLLLRLGRADLAEALYASGTSWTPKDPSRDVADPPITEYELMTDWLRSAFDGFLKAHHEGDDGLALAKARGIKTFRERAEARLTAMGVERPAPNNQITAILDNEQKPQVDYFQFLTWQFEKLRLQHEARASSPERGPIPDRGGDPAARVAALIRDLDQINEFFFMNPGGTRPEAPPLMKSLIEEGNAAVEPLLAILESDNRLTRTITQGGNPSHPTYVHPVYEVALQTLDRLMPTGDFPGQRPYAWVPLTPEARKSFAGSMRQHWLNTKDLPLMEQWYRILRKDDLSPDKWDRAAIEIAFPPHGDEGPTARPGMKPPAGEMLRVGKEPSVSALISQRIDELRLRFDPDEVADTPLMTASSLAFSLSNWDEAAALPWLRELSREWRMRSDLCRIDNSQQSSSLLPEFTTIRVRLGDVEALDDYAAWISSTTPNMLCNIPVLTAFQPMIDHRDHPSVARASRWMFTSPLSPWLPLAVGASTYRWPNENLFASPLISLSTFREALRAGLCDKSVFGIIIKVEGDPNQLQYTFRTEPLPSPYAINGELPGVSEVSFRTSDYIASKLSEIPGAPLCELFWPEARRDEAVAAMIVFLDRFGERLVSGPTPVSNNGMSIRARLAFPSLDKPASGDDVAHGRAIFSLEGQGETRLVTLPKVPERARLVGTKEGHDAVVGWVWQAEEVNKGGVWQRYYGFVGQHSVKKVAASEIEFIASQTGWQNSKAGLVPKAGMIGD
jgi:hypothetical protein